MIKLKNTKRALLGSALALLLCASLLVGSTFAWFTDSVTSMNNKIVAGNLDVVLEYKTDWNDTWQPVQNNAPIFEEGALYEPGYTEVVYLRVSNAGSLALKYNLKVDIFGEQTSVNVNNEEFSLSDYLQIGSYRMNEFADGENQANVAMPEKFGTRAAALANGQNFTVLSQASGILASDAPVLVGADTAQVLALVLTMPETVGNDANYKVGAPLPEITLGITLVATQYTNESDSFGSNYDADAEYPVAFTDYIDAETPVEEVYGIFEEGGVVLVKEDIVLSPSLTRATNYLNTGNTTTIYAEDGAKIIFEETTVFRGDGKIIVKSGSLETNKELCISGNATLVIDGGEHSFGAFSATSDGSVIVNGGVLNCYATYAGIMSMTFGENGSLVVNGGLLNMHQPFNLNPNRCDAVSIEINGGTIDLLDNTENLFVVRNIMDKDLESGVLRGSSIKVTGGTFIAHYEVDSAGDATAFIRNGDGTADTNRVLVSNTFNGNADYQCEVSGGTFYGSWQRADNVRYQDGNGGYSDGLFVENSIAGFVADGYQIIGNPDDGYIVTAE